MLPTAATALSAAQLAHMFENGAHFLCYFLVGGLAEIELGLVLAVETKCVMQRDR